MQNLAKRLHRPPAEQRYAGGRVDMGNGQVLGPEDVLDGHWSYLLAERSARGARTVTVQVPDNWSAAIQVMAPELAPLTELAQEVADALPAVHPAPQFRRDLYQALEQTHRQYSAQRALGTRPQHGVCAAQRRLPWAAAILTVILTTGLLAWWIRRWARRSPPAS